MRTLRGVVVSLRPSNRDLPAYLHDVIGGQPEEVGDMNGVALHRGKQGLLPCRKGLPVRTSAIALILIYLQNSASLLWSPSGDFGVHHGA